MWNLGSRQHLWAAASRALRTPSLVDKSVHIDLPAFTPPGAALPVVATVDGNPLAADEQLVATEAGYRLEFAGRAALDVTAFASRYRHLQTVEAGDPTLTFLDGGQPAVRVATVFGSLLDADTRGAEVSARIRVNRAWQVVGTWSAFHLTPHLAAESRDPDAGAFDGRAPAHQWRAHSALAFGNRVDTDVLVFHVGPQRQLQVPGYTRVDARLEWTFGGGLSASLQGQNLLRSSHAEFAPVEPTILPTLVRRTGTVRLTWRF